MKQSMIFGTKRKLYFARIWIGVSWFLVKKYKNPLSIFKIVRNLNNLKNRYSVENTFHKLAFVDGRVYFNCNMNGWPAKHFYRPLDIEARNGLYGNVSGLENLRMVQIAFTKKCPLNCEHCYEGVELNKKDTLTLDDHKKIVQKLQNAGISLIQYGGGDPMARVNELVELLDFAEKTSDFWVFTSGFNFNMKNAERLKKAGLTGVSIGLDHYLPEKHNAFRRNEKAFDWVLEAAESAVKNKLVLAFTICVTRDFCTEENLMNYLTLAGRLGASFVQLLEPRAEGNYAGKDVMLNQGHFNILEKFFVETNSESKYRDLPIVLYTGYHQRKQGCPGAGSKFLYIDTDGYMNSCPFCRNKKTHILDENHEQSIKELKQEGCELVENLN